MTEADASLYHKFRGAPIMTTLGLLVLVSGSLTAGVNLTGFWDKNHTTKQELADVLLAYPGSPAIRQAVSAATEEREEIRREGRCGTLEIKISIVEQQIWQMENANDNGQRLVEKRAELRTLLQSYATLRCASVR